MKFLPPFASTAIGSVPYDNIETAVSAMNGFDVPANPQMVAISPWEDMFLGALHGLPGLIVDRENQVVRAKKNDRENELADFYSKFLSGDFSFLALAPESRRGFDAFLKNATRDKDYGAGFLKSQIIGPLTFSQMVLMEDEKSSLVDDLELREAIARALGGQAAWQAAQIRKTGRDPVMFIDEPGLSSFGSAFCRLSEEVVVETMGLALETARSQGAVSIGCHVCGNTDWGLMTRLGLDIINFDAYNFFEQFGLYLKDLDAFLRRGGRIAWGIVPAQGFEISLKAEDLINRLSSGWRDLAKKGLDYDLITQNSLITTACGLGTLSPEEALAATGLVAEISKKLTIGGK